MTTKKVEIIAKISKVKMIRPAIEVSLFREAVLGLDGRSEKGISIDKD
jgi:hypothetical protein